MKSSLKILFVTSLSLNAALASAQPVTDFIENSKAWGSVVADFNRDGHDDIFVTGHDPDDRVWYWTPTGYLPSSQAFPWVDRHDCDVADVNRDGKLDMYCVLGSVKGTGSKLNELWLQTANGSFAASMNFGAEDTYGRGRRPQFFDLNHDGYPDLYVANEATARADGQPNINHVFINQRGKRFVETTTIATGDRGFQCLTKGDVDGDGWDDLLLCNEQGPGHIYVNNHANDFRELSSPAINEEWTDAKLVDVNGDGRVDLVVIAPGNVLKVWLNTGAAPYFSTISFQDTLPGHGVSLAVGDFDHDGVKDIYVVLQDSVCKGGGEPGIEAVSSQTVDKAPDVVYRGLSAGGFARRTLSQDLIGCGHLADVVDGSKILLENGDVGDEGPSFVIDRILD